MKKLQISSVKFCWKIRLFFPIVGIWRLNVRRSALSDIKYETKLSVLYSDKAHTVIIKTNDIMFSLVCVRSTV